MAEVERLYKCIVCGKAYAKKQALRGHMKKHKGEGYKRTSIYLLDEDREYLNGYTRKHNTTTCHFIHSVIQACKEGEKTGTVHIGAPNPVIIQVNEYFLGKPRSAWKQQLDIEALARLQRRCPQCGAGVVQEFQPEGTSLVDGRCRECGAEWLISPGVVQENGRRRG